MSTLRAVVGAVLAVTVLTVAGCGAEEEEGSEGNTPRERAPTRLHVEVRPEAKGSLARTRTVECEGAPAASRSCDLLEGIEGEDFAPVGARACTQVFGGSATARVTGTLRGRVIDARFSLVNGCEIERWRRLSVLLGPPPVGGGPRPRD